MDELLTALDSAADDLRELKTQCDDRDRLGGPERAEFLEETLDELVPELEELCKRRWMLELLVRLCRFREG